MNRALGSSTMRGPCSRKERNPISGVRGRTPPLDAKRAALSEATYEIV